MQFRYIICSDVYVWLSEIQLRFLILVVNINLFKKAVEIGGWGGMGDFCFRKSWFKEKT